ncbi:MAG: hypothetical protein LBV30_08745 [Propionibacteriaceae bacterium]|jgi:hypothetical protein|nr:hypothetical protein [Propionibacteriaceae bacterium]
MDVPLGGEFIARDGLLYPPELWGAEQASIDQSSRSGESSDLDPLFNGSVGSTYRMVKYLSVASLLDEALPDEYKERVQAAVMSQLSTDAMHRLAGEATLSLLDPAGRRQLQIESALDEFEQWIGEEPMDESRAFLWTYGAEYSGTLEVPLDYPGLTDGAVDTWLDNLLLGAAWPAAQFLIGLYHNGVTELGTVESRLMAGLRDHLLSLDISTSASTELFTAELAVFLWSGTWTHPVADLLKESEQRWGDCLGGYSVFIRENRDVNQWCNVDASLEVIVSREYWESV